MTIASTTNKVQFTGDGVTTSFAFPYPFFSTADLLVTLLNTTTSLAVSPAPVLGGGATYDYTITGTLDPTTGEYLSGGTVVFTTAPLSTYRVTIEQTIAMLQSIALADNSKFPAAAVNAALDRLTLLIQRDRQLTSQCIQVPSADVAASVTLPAAALRASTYLGFDSLGNVSLLAAVSGTTPVSAAMLPVVTAATLALARTAMGVINAGDNINFTGTVQFGGVALANQNLSGPTTQNLTSGSGATYTTPAGVKWIRVRMVGGGGGGGGAGLSTGPTGGTGGTTIFNSINANGGTGGGGSTGGGVNPGGAGGTGGTGSATFRFTGNAGGTGGANSASQVQSGYGAASFFGGGTQGDGVSAHTPAPSAPVNTGGGGAGAAGTIASTGSASGGGSGEYVEIIIRSPAGTYTYTVGAVGAGGIGTGTSATTGGAGGTGRIVVEEYYNFG